MKKIFMIALAILISVAFVTTVFAQAPKDAPKPAAAADKPAVDKPAKAEKAAKPAKAKAKAFTGEVVNADAAAFVAKDKKGEMTFDVSGVKGYKAEDDKAGDKVVVKYAEKDGKKMASAIKKVKAPAKKEKKEEKKEAPAKAEPAKPATPATPAKK
jgi:hypothetical protein